MYAKYFQRCLSGLMVCLAVFSLCFILHGTVSATESTPSEAGSTVSQDTSSLPESSDSTSSGEGDESDGVSSDSSDENSDVSEEESDTQSDESIQDSESGESDASDVSSEDVVSQVSEGGAPDFYDEHYYNDGSYEYHGSYTGLSSDVSDKDKDNTKDKAPANRSALAQKYAKYFTYGMIVFGCLSVLMVVLLIYFNLKVKQSKLTYPDWYRRREARKKGKHAKH